MTEDEAIKSILSYAVYGACDQALRNKQSSHEAAEKVMDMFVMLGLISPSNKKEIE